MACGQFSLFTTSGPGAIARDAGYVSVRAVDWAPDSGTPSRIPPSMILALIDTPNRVLTFVFFAAP